MIRRRRIALPARYRSRIQTSSYVYGFFAILIITFGYLWGGAGANGDSITTQQAAIQHVCENYTDVYKKATTPVQRIKLRNIYKKYCLTAGKEPNKIQYTGAIAGGGGGYIQTETIGIQEFTTFSRKNEGAISILQDMRLHKQQDQQNIFVGFQKDTLLKSRRGKEVLPEQFQITLKKTAEKKPMGEMFTEKSMQFDMGVSGEHLIFSKPVKIEIPTDFPDGKIIDVLVLHEGDQEPNKNGLTENPDATCKSDGTVSKSDKLFTTTVKEGYIVFYTCGASLFTMNPVGGLAGSNDLRIMIGDYGQVQIYYNNLAQIYGGAVPSAGAGGPSAWPILNIGTTEVGNSVGVAWTSATTTGQQIGNTYQAQTTLVYTTAGRTYTLIINWEYVAPNKYFTWTYTLTVPTGNTQNVRFYYGMDSYVAGGDANDVGYYSTNPSLTVGVYDNVAKVLSAQRYVSGRMWSGYEAAGYSTIRNRITANTNYNNTITSSAGDLGYGINWFFGTTPGTYTSTTEWRVAPYVATTVPDLIPGIGQPVPSLAVNSASQIPMTITNVGNTGSNGTHTGIFYIPSGINGPTVGFATNGWVCGAMNSTARTVTCVKNMILGNNITDTFYIPVTPTLATQGQTLRFTGYIMNLSDSNNTNNTGYINLQVAVSAPIGNVTALAPSSLSTISINTSLQSQILDMVFNQSTGQAFAIDDSKGNNSGYNATLQLSGNLVSTVGSYVIGASNVGILGTPSVFLLSGSTNPLVQPTTSSSTPFRGLNGIQNIMRRNPGANSNVKSRYGVYLPLRINIPAAQPAGIYQGVLVFTVIEN